MNPARRVRGVALGAALITVAAVVFDSWGAATWWGVPALAVGVALSEVAVVSLQFGRQTWAFSLTESVLGAAWVLHPGAWSVFGVMIGVLVAQVTLKRPRIKKQFNIAMFSCATALGSLTAGAT